MIDLPNNISTYHSILFIQKANVTNTDGKSTIDVKEIVGTKDPFLLIAPLVTKALFNKSNADLPVQDNYLQHIKDVCGNAFLSSVECTYKSIKEHCSHLSVFAGCNPFVSKCTITYLLLVY